MASLFGTLVLLAVAILATEALQLPVRRTTGSSVNFATHRFCRLTYRKSSTTLGASSKPSADTKTATKNNKASGKAVSSDAEEEKGPSAFDQVASKGLAGVLAIAAAEAIFWAAGMPLAALWVRFTTGEWIDLMSTEGQLQAAGFTFGYGGFATLILQYRVTLFAIPLVPIMEKYVVQPGKKYFGEQFGEKKE